jgi:hypothetical protein
MRCDDLHVIGAHDRTSVALTHFGIRSTSTTTFTSR